jgi:BirA family biotin operon repressor/biotin-[acetyl-CoA-carboxylase] ligase
MSPKKSVPSDSSDTKTLFADSPLQRPSQTSSQILQELKRAPGTHVSGTSLASLLGMTRTSVWKHIQALRARGYKVETHPKLGYRLVDTPDLLLPETFLPLLRTERLGRVYHHLPQTTSTNDQAMAMALQGSPHGTLVVAEEQTHGRGRLQRPWASAPRHGLYFSLVLRGPFPFERAPQATMVAALSLTRLIRNSWALEASTKWPNDVLIQGKKVAGILTEAQSDPDQVHFLIMGIGINVNHTAADLEGPFRYPATSMALELGYTLKRPELLALYLEGLEVDYDKWMRGGFDSFSREWESTSWILNKTVRLQGSEGALTGQVVGFTSEGALRLLQHDGMERVIWAGDVERVEGIA